MANERISLTLPGFLTTGMVSASQSAGYDRTVTKVSLSTNGAPSASPVVVQLQVNGVPDAAQYTLGTGLLYADNTGTLFVPENALLNVVVASPGTVADLIVWIEFSVKFSPVVMDTTDCGLGTLGQLKRFIMNPVAADTNYDEPMILIGLGVSKLFDQLTGRFLRRAVGAVEFFPAYRKAYYVKHAPLEAITDFQAKYNEVYGWQELVLPNSLDLIEYDTGKVRVHHGVMRDHGQFQLTLTGGYFIDLTDDGEGVLPTGATALPDDIRSAWLLQCQHIWRNRENLGIGFAPSGETGKDQRQLDKVQVLPLVGSVLANYAWPMEAR